MQYGKIYFYTYDGSNVLYRTLKIKNPPLNGLSTISGDLFNETRQMGMIPVPEFDYTLLYDIVKASRYPFSQQIFLVVYDTLDVGESENDYYDFDKQYADEEITGYPAHGVYDQLLDIVPEDEIFKGGVVLKRDCGLMLPVLQEVARNYWIQLNSSFIEHEEIKVVTGKIGDILKYEKRITSIAWLYRFPYLYTDGGGGVM